MGVLCATGKAKHFTFTYLTLGLLLKFKEPHLN